MVAVTIEVNGFSVGNAKLGYARPDIEGGFPDYSNAANSGFVYLFDDKDFLHVVGSHAEIRVIFTTKSGATYSDSLSLPRNRTTESPDTGSLRSYPLPLSLVQSIVNISADTSLLTQEWDERGEQEAVERLTFLLKHASRRECAVFSYFSFLNRIHAAIRFAQRHFTVWNRYSGKDARNIASSHAEMMTIGHHLFNLASYGERGPLLEFGSFKGFSTACLSHACAALDWSMLVFDSFCGLPASQSLCYSEGDFAGHYEEVLSNVRAFGAPQAVTFYEGFFSDSVAKVDLDTVSCIWMDVDLESSSRDAMAVLDKLSPRGCVFSHECLPGFFRKDNSICAERSPDNVLPPIVDAFGRAGITPRGELLVSTLGVIQRPDSVPVLRSASVVTLAQLAHEGC
jgi:hypothetical protein